MGQRTGKLDSCLSQKHFTESDIGDTISHLRLFAKLEILKEQMMSSSNFQIEIDVKTLPVRS